MLISEIKEIEKSLRDQDLLEMQSNGSSFRVTFLKFYEWVKQKLNLADVAYTGKFQDLKEIPPLPTKGYIDSRDQQTYNQAKGYTDGVASAKVDKEEGKGLSSNDYTDFDKNKMDSVQHGATRLRIATKSVLGGIKVGDNLEVLSDGTLNATADAQVNSDWLATEGNAEILNKPDLSVLATYEYVDEQVDEAVVESKEYTDTIVGDIDYSEFATKEGVEQGLSLKVDKEEGKQLSTEDYTTAEKSKLLGVETGAQVNPIPVDDLFSDDVSYPLSARQGKVLKGFIDTINDILTSDDTNLDELQEIVDFIKLNREDLDSLTINSIAGLEDALSNKQPLSSILTNTSASFTTTLLSKLNNIEANAQVNTVNSVAGKTGTVVLNKNDVGLNNVDNTSDTNKPISVPVQNALSNKVDKEAGKQLSTEDFTTGEKTKLSGIAVGATQNASDASLRDRATHTGVQPISSVEGLQTALNSIPTLVSELENDSGYLTEETDPTVPAWAKEPTKPSYTKDEVGLGNVDNTSDVDKPISTATQTALDLKLDTSRIEVDNLPTTKPTLLLDFANSKFIGVDTIFESNSEKTGWVNGQLKTFGINEPRFVTDPVTGYSGLLLEPFASTNLVHNSLRPLLWGWSANWNVTPIQNIDGTMTAMRGEILSPSTATVTVNYPGTGSLTITQITRPILIDGVPRPSIAGLLRNNSQEINGAGGSYTIDTGATTGSCVSGRHLGDGWYETVFVYPEEELPGPPVAGDNLWWYFNGTSTTVGTVREIAGIQIETGTKATSFIPTGDSQVTRAGDFFTLPVGDWYRPDQGTLLVDGIALSGTKDGGYQAALVQNGIRIIGAGRIVAQSERSVRVRNGGSPVDAIAPGGPIPLGGRIILAIGWNSNGFVGSANGTVSEEVVQPDGYPSPTELRLSAAYNGTWPASERTPSVIIRRVAYYPERLTDAQLAALTEVSE